MSSGTRTAYVNAQRLPSDLPSNDAYQRSASIPFCYGDNDGDHEKYRLWYGFDNEVELTTSKERI
jgi:hypothetical protein